MMSKIGLLLILPALFLASAVTPPIAEGHHLLSTHKLDCGKDFPCPQALRTRIDFWIDVFTTWHSEQAVLHDAEHPGRVFDVVDNVDGCNKTVDRQRDRLKQELLALATKVEQGRPVKGKREYHLLNTFPRHKAVDIRASAGRLRCQQGTKDRFEDGVKRYHRYREMVVRILQQHDLPTDLQYLPFVESSYNPAAYSKAAAAGLWQIMPATARGLGLELGATLDERLDPEAATIAAARYLQDARTTLKRTAKEIKRTVSDPEIYPFVVTSYNYGVNGMRRAVQQEGPDFMRVLTRYKSPAFQVAVKNFYASFLAARHVARNTDIYFGKPKGKSPLDYQTVVLQRPASINRIKKVFGVNAETLKSLNPALTRFVWNDWRQMPDGYRLRLPAKAGGWQKEIAVLEAAPAEEEQLYKPEYLVKRGDTACSIAQAFRVQCQDLIAANQLGKQARIRVGQKLQIPGRSRAKEPASPATAGAGKPRMVETSVQLKYQVRKGDTACVIAKRHNVPCRELISFNNLGRKALVRQGQWLTIPGGGVKGAAAAVQGGKYKVRRGDTLCQLAESFHLSCSTLMAANDLDRKGTIRVGQELEIPAGDGAPSRVPAEYTVQAGDTACVIAERFDVPCKQLIADNRLNRSGAIRVGQTLRVAAAGSIAPATDQQVSMAGADRSLLRQIDTLPELGVELGESSGKPRYTIRVAAEESMGHYADWLGIRRTADLYRLNNLKPKAALTIGKRIRLPIQQRETVSRFQRKREEYHQVLAEEFKERYEIPRLDNYSARSGDSAWSIAGKHDMPLWLLLRFNPELETGRVATGQKVIIPIIKDRKKS